MGRPRTTHFDNSSKYSLAALSGVFIKVTGAKFSDRGDQSRQFVALRFDLFDGIHGSGSLCMTDSKLS